jgi:hypothetical protein
MSQSNTITVALKQALWHLHTSSLVISTTSELFSDSQLDSPSPLDNAKKSSSLGSETMKTSSVFVFLGLIRLFRGRRGLDPSSESSAAIILAIRAVSRA